MPITMEPHSGPSLVGMLKDAWEAMKAPGKAYNEGMTPDEMIKAGNNFAMTMGAGGSLVPKPGNSLGMFGGKLAKTANLDKLKQAEIFEKAGVPADHIWKATGWAKGKDGHWRFEIDDSKATLNEGISKIKRDRPYNTAALAGDIYEHPALFDAYPELKNIKLTEELSGASGGSYGGKISLNLADPKKLNSIMGHEMQHEIQNIEGFARGNNPDDVAGTLFTELMTKAIKGQNAAEKNAIDKVYMGLEKRLKDAEAHQFRYRLYKSMAGEVEARNVQTRLNFNPLRRAINSPWATEDIPRAQQLLFGHKDK